MLSTRHAELIATSDVELLRRTYALVPRVGDEDLSDEFYWLLTEAFERFAPDAERAYVEEEYAGKPHEGELGAALRMLRERQGARMIRSALEGAGDA